MYCDYAIFANEFPEVSLLLCFPISLFPFPIQYYNWSNNGVNDSLWLGLRAQCIYSNAVLQPVIDFYFSSEGELIVPSLQAPCSEITSLSLSLFVHCHKSTNHNSVSFFHFQETIKKNKKKGE